MTYSPHGFCRGLEGGIQALAMAAANAAAQERMIDRSAPQAVEIMSRALRRERHLNAALSAELQIALGRIAELEAAADATRPRRSANPR